MLQCHHYEPLELGKLHPGNNWPYHQAGSHSLHSFVWHHVWNAAWESRLLQMPGFRSHDRKAKRQQRPEESIFWKREVGTAPSPAPSVARVIPNELKSLRRPKKKRSKWLCADTIQKGLLFFESPASSAGLTRKLRAEMSFPATFFARFPRWVGSAQESNGIFVACTGLLCQPAVLTLPRTEPPTLAVFRSAGPHPDDPRSRLESSPGFP